MKFKCIFFDFDGVIIRNSQILFLETMQNTLYCRGLELDLAYYINNFLGWKGETILNHIKKEYNFESTTKELEKIRNQYKVLLLENPEIDPSIYKLLESVNHCYICSSNNKDFIKQLLVTTKLKKYFHDKNIFSLEDTSKLKPDPMIYLNALQHSGYLNEDCCAIEDSVTGAIAARAANLYTFGYIGSLPIQARSGYSTCLNNVGVNKIINHFNEV